MTTWIIENSRAAGSTAERAEQRYREQLRTGYRRADQLFAVLLVLEWSVAIAVALLGSPYAWAGESRSVHVHVWAAIFLGGAIVSLPVVLTLFRPAAAATRQSVGISQMLMSALMIHLSGGRIEVHFLILVSLAFLAIYRDEKVLITASIVVALDHLLRGIFWPGSVYGVLTVSPWRWVEHAAWIVFEDIVLIRACRQSHGELRELALGHAEIEAARARVEQRVEERTAALSLANRELTRQAGELRESETMMASIIETAPDAIVTVDHLGRISEFNPAAESIFGHSKNAAVGRLLDELFVLPGERRHDVESQTRLIAVSDQESGLRFRELSSLRADGTAFPAELTVSQVNREGRPPLFVGFVRDITVRKLAEASLRHAADTAQAASRAKSEFLANMSHEIRTPMNGIIGMTELALDTELTFRQREYLGLVRSSADALLTVINDILDFSKIEAGKLSLDHAPFGLRDALGETLQALALRAHSKGLELACRIAPDVPDCLIGDSGRLRQVLVNLVGNAIKFTERGEVIAAVSIDEANETSVTLRVSAADTGIGIPAEKVQTIFQPFEQADGSTTRRFGGTGLGLTISAKLVELMGGTIWVESEVGVGSTFWFTVKMGVPAQAHACVSEPDHSQLEGLPVLVVDDNATNRLILTELLTNWGMRPTAVDGGHMALASLRRGAGRGEPFPIALIDGMMPVMDGIDLAEEIRREPEIAAVRLLLLTSAGQPDDTARCRALSISVCLTKPVRQSELFDALVKEIAIWNRSEEVRRPQTISAELKSAAPRPDGLRVLLAEDHPVNQKVAVRMLQHQGHSVVVAPDGREALKALERDRFDLVLMDLQMPEMDGFEALTAIRDRETLTGDHVPVIALTAHAMHGDRERCLEAGFDGYLAKPIRQADLQAAIASLEPVASQTSLEPDHPFLAGLTEVCGGDDEFAHELALSFLESAPACLSAIELAIQSGDSRALGAGAHALSGISRTIGAGKLAASCGKLEEIARRGDLAAAAHEAARLQSTWEHLRAALEEYLVVEVKE